MNIDRLIQLLREFDSYDRLGFAGRPDDSGIRSKGVKRKPDRRLPNFPYDKDVFYGQPNAYDRGSSATGPLERPLTPHDDSNFSLKLLGLDQDEIEEMMGSPILMARGNSNQTGTTVPGVTGWANNPPKNWDDEDDIDSVWTDLDARSHVEEGPLNIDTRPPDIEEVPNSATPDFHLQTDDDLENRFDRIWGREDNMNFVDPKLFGTPDSHVIAPDPWSVISARLSSRGLYGLMPKESAWDRISGMVMKKREIS